MDKTNKILTISSIVLIGFFLSVIFHYIFGIYLQKPYPLNTFLFAPEIAFDDFTKMMIVVKDFAPFKTVSMWINYFPLAYIILFPFSLIKNKILAYAIFASPFAVFLTWSNIRNFTCKDLTKLQNFQNIFIMTVLSYPVLCILDRGNFDMFLFLLFAGFIYCFKAEKYLISSVLLAVINAIKPFTLIFLVLFLFKKRYKELIFNLLITSILAIGGFMLLHGGIFAQISVFLKNLLIFKMQYVYQNNNDFGMTNDSSLYMALKLLLCRLTVPPIMTTNLLVKIYSWISFVLAGVIIFFAWREKIFWKKITLLTLSMLLLPYLVNDYKLIFLFVPMWLFVNAEEKSKFDLLYSVLFALIILPKNLVILQSVNVIENTARLYKTGVAISPLLMLIFIGLLIYDQFYKKKYT